MNKKRGIILTIVLIIVVILGLWISGIILKRQEPELEPELEPEKESIETVTEIGLGEIAWIDSLTKIKIKNTNDYFEITTDLKNLFEEDKNDDDTLLIDSAWCICYTFIVDNVSYKGWEIIGMGAESYKDDGLKYNLEIHNFGSGKIKVEVTK